MTMTETIEHHLVLYDGVCGLCNKLVQFILARDKEDKFRFAALQSDVAKKQLRHYGYSLDTLDTVYVIPHYETKQQPPLFESKATLFILEELGWPWEGAKALGVLPASFLDWGYHAVAKNRYWLFGKYDTCLLPSPDEKRKFIDQEKE